MSASYYGDVERVVRIDRAYMVAAAAARDFNDELTVIMSSLEGVLRVLGGRAPSSATAERPTGCGAAVHLEVGGAVGIQLAAWRPSASGAVGATAWQVTAANGVVSA